MAIDLITEHIKMKLQQPELRRLYHNLEVMPSNYQIRGMHTLIRDRATSKADFVFYADRLLRLVRARLACPAQGCSALPSPAQQLPDPGHAHARPRPGHLQGRLRLLCRPPAAPGARAPGLAWPAKQRWRRAAGGHERYRGLLPF